MKDKVYKILIIVFSIILVINVFSILKTNRKEKRISDFSLSKKDFDNTTFLEKLSIAASSPISFKSLLISLSTLGKINLL